MVGTITASFATVSFLSLYSRQHQGAERVLFFLLRDHYRQDAGRNDGNGKDRAHAEHISIYIVSQTTEHILVNKTEDNRDQKADKDVFVRKASFQVFFK